ncbi:hypothetical protein [Roseivirga thermotolerans]|uniref:hypothetical protein n=1 Tax=Roseivirga thermotolerans TaxID=1758176 RepID=UPI00273E59A1|nr:hypothetical protein [Roseivirga thermotolerans]
MDEYYLKCECQGEVLSLTNVKENAQVHLAIYNYGYGNQNSSLWQRIKFALYHLTTGKIYADAVVISHEQAEHLGKWLANVGAPDTERSDNRLCEHTTNTIDKNPEHRS